MVSVKLPHQAGFHAGADGQAALMTCWRALLRLLTANTQQLTEIQLAPLWAGLEASLTFAAAYPSSQAGA